jgi:hypothetical protein
MPKHRIYSASVASVYPLYVAKAEKKGRTKAEVYEIICWLTGYSQETLGHHLENKHELRVVIPPSASHASLASAD